MSNKSDLYTKIDGKLHKLVPVEEKKRKSTALGRCAKFSVDVLIAGVVAVGGAYYFKLHPIQFTHQPIQVHTTR